MKRPSSISIIALLTMIGAGGEARAQADAFACKFNSGQSVQPMFEGWSKNPDGTFEMHFGYLNRNWIQTPHLPPGPDNAIEPGGPDRGQPTFFYPRLNRSLFSVTVPK